MSSNGAGRSQGRSGGDIIWQAVPDLSTSNRKSTTTNSWQAEGRNVKLIRQCRSQPSSVRHVSNTSKLRRRRTVQSTQCPRGYLEDDPLWNTKPVKTDQCIGDVFRSSRVENEPRCCILIGLQTLDETGRQVDQQTVTVMQPAENKCNDQ